MYTLEILKIINYFRNKIVEVIFIAFYLKEAIVEEVKKRVITTYIKIFSNKIDTKWLINISKFFANYLEYIRIFLIYLKKVKKIFLK